MTSLTNMVKKTSNIIFKLPIRLKAIHKLRSIWLLRSHLITFKTLGICVFSRGFFCSSSILLSLHFHRSDRSDFEYWLKVLNASTKLNGIKYKEPSWNEDITYNYRTCWVSMVRRRLFIARFFLYHQHIRAEFLFFVFPSFCVLMLSQWINMNGPNPAVCKAVKAVKIAFQRIENWLISFRFEANIYIDFDGTLVVVGFFLSARCFCLPLTSFNGIFARETRLRVNSKTKFTVYSFTFIG